MKRAAFASDLVLKLVAVCPQPTCPYCGADAPAHWTGHGSYTRYAGDPEEPSRRTDVARYKCGISGRTFSLLPDALLPYCGTRTGFVLQWLQALLVDGVGVNTLARRAGVTRGRLRYLRARFLRVLPKLRLPWHEGCLCAAGLLEALAQAGAAAVADLFRGWKQQEPKLSIVGIYQR